METPSWAVKESLRSRLPAPFVSEVLRGETTSYAGGTVDLLPVCFTCSSMKNVATEVSVKPRKEISFLCYGLGVLLDSVASQREAEEKANVQG